MKKVLFIFVITLISCTKSNEVKKHPWDEFKRKTFNGDGAGDVLVPDELISKVEDTYQHSSDYMSVEQYKKATSQPRLPREKLPFSVILAEKSKGVLGGEHLELKFPSGAGQIDFSKYIATKSGQLLLYLNIETTNPISVLFLPDIRLRKIDGAEVGLGCNKYSDITRYFSKAMEQGLLLDTEKAKHLSFIGGTLFITTTIDAKLYVARLQIKDSRYPELVCPR